MKFRTIAPSLVVIPLATSVASACDSADKNRKDSQDSGSNAAGTLQAGTHGQGGCPKISRIRSFQQHGHKLVSPEHSARRRNCCQFQSKREDAALGKHTTLSIFPQLFTAVWKI